MITLAHPTALLLVLALAGAMLLRRGQRGRGALALPGAGLGHSGGPGLAVRLPELLRPAGILLAILALAGPGLAPGETTYSGQGVDLMLAIDLSPSMAAMDMPQGQRTVTRLAAVVEAARALADSRPGDRIGLVAFGARAYAVLPPTTDRASLAQALAHLEPGAAGARTAMGDAVGLAAKRLIEGPGLSRAVIVFGDGRSNAGETDPIAAARAAARHGVKVFAVGVGRDGPAPFLVSHPLLGRQVVHESAPVDAAALAAMAREGDGVFWSADDPAGLARATAAIHGLTPSDIRAVAPDTVPLAPPLAGAAACLLAAWAAWASGRGLKLP
jgi:Ca-activated chloride channel family protein